MFIIFLTHISVSPVEAIIIGTAGNLAGTQWDNTHTGLTDNAGLDGTRADVSSKSRCAVSQRGSDKMAFLSMKLKTPRKILMIQLAFRTDGYQYQGQNVMVQVGSSPLYNPDNPVCKEIDQLTGTGLIDYNCDQYHEDQYVILSNDQKYLTICEAKVFVVP